MALIRGVYPRRLRERFAVEHTLACERRRRGERTRYRGVAKNDFALCRIAAVNNFLAIDRRIRTGEAARALA